MKTKMKLVATGLIASALIFTACDSTTTTDEPKSVIADIQPITSPTEDVKDSVVTDANIPQEDNTPTNNQVENVTNDVDSKVISDSSIDVEVEHQVLPTTNQTKGLSLFEMKEDQKYQADFHSGWKKNSSGANEATIDGRGEESLEEGQGILVVQNNKTLVSKLYSIKGDNGTQITPKYVEWINEDELYVIIGFAYGTVSKGGELYRLNVENDSLIPAIHNLKENEEVVSVKSNNNGTFTYQKHIYDDENMTVGHFEEGTLPLQNN